MLRFYFLIIISISFIFSSAIDLVGKDSAQQMNVELISSDINNNILKFTLDGFYLVDVKDNEKIVKTNSGSSLLEKGNIGPMC